MKPSLGTLIRCPDITGERLAFYRKIGLSVLQLAGVNEDYLAPGDEAKRRSETLFALFREYGFSVPCLFLSYPAQDWAHPKETCGLVPDAFRTERMLLSCRQMQWAARYGIRYISCHVGFLPEKDTASYDAFVKEMRQLVLFAESNGQQFLFETGDQIPLGEKDFFGIRAGDLAEIAPGGELRALHQQTRPHAGTQRMPFEISPGIRIGGQVIRQFMPGKPFRTAFSN